MSDEIKLELTLNIYVRFTLFDRRKRVLVAQKVLSFFENDSVQYMTRFIANEIETLQHDADLADIWDRVEINVTKCYISGPNI